MDKLKKETLIGLVVVGLIIVILVLFEINMPLTETTERINEKGEVGEIIKHCDDGIICRRYNLITQPVCFRDRDLVRRYCNGN